MHLRSLKLALVLVLFAGVSAAFAHSAGPSPGYTGAPGEFNCRQCHSSFSLNDGAGSVTLEGVPAVYDPGETYTITVRVARQDRSRWGFQLTALTASLDAAGTFSVVDAARTQIKTDDGKSYVSHRTQGTFAGTTGGATWAVRWTAPGAGAGPVDFYVAGNAANNNGAQTGDNIYTTFATSSPAVDEAPFEDVTSASGLGSVSGGMGVAWSDFDLDGDADVLVATEGRDLLYRNGNGAFVEIGASLGIAETDETLGAAWGDFDGDARPDLALATAAGPRLYRNTASGFADATATSGIAAGRAALVAWSDYDGDGRLDLLVGYDAGAALYRNAGDGTFEDATAAAGLAGLAGARVAAWADATGDARADLFVATASGATLFEQTVEGSFTAVDVAGAAGARDAAWADYDGDGRLDLFVATGAAVKLFRNAGGGALSDVTTSAGLAGVAGTALAVDDSDGDGRVDVLVSDASGVRLKRFEASAYVDKTDAAGFDGVEGGVATWADADGDGHVDLFVLSASGATLRRNPSGAATLTVRARTAGGADAVGATVAMDEDGNFGTGTRQVRVLSGGGSASQPPARAVFSTPFSDAVTVRATFAAGLGRETSTLTGTAAAATLDEPASGPSIASVSYKLKDGTDKLLVNGAGFATNAEVVEVDGVAMDATKYPKKKRLGDGTSTRIVGTDGSFDALVPSGREVFVTTFDATTGVRSAPFAFIR